METKEFEARARLRHLHACVLPLLAEDGEKAGVHGSGLLFTRDGRHYVVTATHVGKFWETHPDSIGVPATSTVGTGEAWSLGRGQLAMAPEDGEDVAVYRLDEPVVAERLHRGDYVFLTDSDVEPDPNSALTCGVFGWPAAGARQVDRVLHGKALVMRLGRLPAPPNSRATDIFLEWPGVADVPELGGISGSPIWGLSESSGLWHPSKEIKLVGVQHSVKRGHWIKGTSWNVVAMLIDKLSPT